MVSYCERCGQQASEMCLEHTPAPTHVVDLNEYLALQRECSLLRLRLSVERARCDRIVLEIRAALKHQLYGEMDLAPLMLTLEEYDYHRSVNKEVPK